MNKLIGLIFLLISTTVFAQRDTVKIDEEDEFKIEAMPYYNFGKGVGMTSPDSLFQMNIRFRMQNRLEIASDGGETTYDAMIRRLRLRWDGYVGDPRFKYAIQLSFSPRDVGRLQDNGDLNVIRDAMVFYTPNKNWSLGFGQTKLPGNRQRVNSSGALQLTDRSINNANFNIDRDFGIQAYYLQNHNEDEFGYNIKTAISTGEGRNWTKTKDNGLAYTGRIELYPLGAFKKGGEYFEGDLMREETPKLYLGATYHYNQKAKRVSGETGSQLFDEKDLNSVLADIAIKYNGWALMGSYMTRTTPNHSALSYNPEDITDFNFVSEGKGFDTQLSYNFPGNWEVIGRNSYLIPSDEIFPYEPKQHQMSVGLTKYIWEHAFKAQMEVTKNNYKFFDGTKDDDWYLRFQIEIGI